VGEVGWSAGSAKLGAARVAANLFAVQFDRDMQFPTARGACSDKANGSCHRFASLFARKSCLPKNPERGDVVAAAIKGADYCGEFFLCQYLNVVFIPCVPCEIAWLGCGGTGKPGGKMDGGTGRGTQGVRGVPFDRWSRRLGLVVGMGFRGIVDDVVREC